MEMVLASGSPRRIEMMKWLKVNFIVAPAELDEKTIRDPDPKMLTKRLAEAKAKFVKDSYPGAIIIGSDAIVYFEGQILEKAMGIDDQKRLLLMQRGKRAQVIVSVCLINQQDGKEKYITKVIPYTMANVSDALIDEYIRSGIGMDKAGGYGLQDMDGAFIDNIDGCFSGVLGFPICEVAKALNDSGVETVANIKGVVKQKTGREC